jgi:hypothetical protein
MVSRCTLGLLGRANLLSMQAEKPQRLILAISPRSFVSSGPLVPRLLAGRKRMIFTALPTTSAGRNLPLGLRGIQKCSFQNVPTMDSALLGFL